MKLAGFDLETSGLEPWNGSIYSMAYYETQGATYKEPSKEDIRALLTHCRDNDIRIVGWNVMFDITWLIAEGFIDLVRECKWLDGMLLLKRIDGWRNSYGLKTVVAEKWPQYADYAIDDFSKPDSDERWDKLLKYNLNDVVFTLTLAKEYLSQMSEKEIEMALIEADVLPELAQAWLDGIYIDANAVASLKQENAAMIEQYIIELNISPEVIASPKQLAETIYGEWELPIIERTEKGAPSTSKDALNKLAVEFPSDDRIAKLLGMRKCMTIKGKYIEAVEKSMEHHKAPITHPQPQAGGTYTSRLTYSSKQGKNKDTVQTGIALHQWSRDKRVRAELIPPPGYLLGEWDFSGQEMRLMADASMDDTLLSVFLDGVDGHAFMGASIKKLDWQWVRDNQDIDSLAKEARYLGKFANLSLQYRIGIPTMRIKALTQYQLNLSEAETVQIKDTYLRTYPKVTDYWRTAIAFANKHGYAETRGGHRIQLDDMEDYSQQQTAINFPIQGTGGDMKLLALSVIKNDFARLGLHFAWDLHDALFLYIPDDSKAIKTAMYVQETLSNLPYKKVWGWEPAVPMPVDGKIGKSWGSLKGYK